jgi:hypothetical protein
MKRALEAVVVAALLLSAPAARATPSTVVWSPATTYTQPYLIPHITYDAYFGERAAYPTDVGVTMGVVPDNKFVEGEIGVDGFWSLLPTPTGSKAGEYQTQNAFQFNGKLSLKEGALFAEAPALSVGAMNVGLTKNLNDYNIAYVVLGKTIGAYGQIGLGAYQGNKNLLVKFASDGAGGVVAEKKANSGLMASYASPKFPVGTIGVKDVSFGVDYMSGSSAFGAGAAAATLYFNDSVSLLTGPVIFNDKYSATGGATNLLWTVQLDVDIDFAKPKPAPKT